MRPMTSHPRYHLVRLVLVYLVSTTSAYNSTRPQSSPMTSRTTWQPNIWLSDLESADVSGAKVAKIQEIDSIRSRLDELETLITQDQNLKNQDHAEMNLYANKTRSKLDTLTAQFQTMKSKMETFMKHSKAIQDLNMTPFGDHFYCFSNYTATWNDARMKCRSYGLELADVETAEENQLLTEHKIKVYGNSNAWLGATDAGHEGRWVWSRSLLDVVYNDWNYPAEPNGGTIQNCMTIGWAYGSLPTRWFDMDCQRSYFFICET